MGILSYGALMNRNKQLGEKIEKFHKTVSLLMQETVIQKQVIGQLHDLLDSYSSNPKKISFGTNSCDRGHLNCKINHAKFTWSSKLKVRARKKSSPKKSYLCKKEEDMSFYRSILTSFKPSTDYLRL